MILLEFLSLIEIGLLCIIIVLLIWVEQRRHNNWYDSFMYQRYKDTVKNSDAGDFKIFLDYEPRSFKLKKSKKVDKNGDNN